MTNKILGFYYKRGSSDVPQNIDINAPFGFDVDSVSNEPVFKYSINDVEKAFVKAREFNQAANYSATQSDFIGDSVGASNCLLIECGNTDAFDYSELASEDPSTQFWQDVFRCAEFIGRNQATVQTSPWSSNYTNYGDAALGSLTDVNGENNRYYVSSYVKGSITYSIRPSSTRLQWVQFVITHLTYGNITIQIYFDADAWCERSASVAYKVYRYEDLDGDSTISNNEMDSQIIGKVFNILKDGKYKKYNSILIDKRISDTSSTTEQFFVFSSIMKDITSTKMKEEIKEYLRGKYDDTYLRYTYPTLFSENEIRIIPVWDNQISQATGSAKDVHALSINKLANVLMSFGYSISSSSADYRPSEIFYVGPGKGWSSSIAIKLIIPLIAIEQDTTSGIQYPISARFPDYKPIYGQNESGAAAEFHFVLSTILNYLQNGDTSLNSEFVSSYSISESKSGNRKVVTFTFANDIWSVYGPIGSGINVVIDN